LEYNWQLIGIQLELSVAGFWKLLTCISWIILYFLGRAVLRAPRFFFSTEHPSMDLSVSCLLYNIMEMVFFVHEYTSQYWQVYNKVYSTVENGTARIDFSSRSIVAIRICTAFFRWLTKKSNFMQIGVISHFINTIGNLFY